MTRDDIGHLLAATNATPSDCIGSLAVTFEHCDADGMIVARLATDEYLRCAFLQTSDKAGLELQNGDTLLVLVSPQFAVPVVVGRIGRYVAPRPEKAVTLEATESLTLRCGKASVELHADGRAKVAGEDILLRAKGTQRIRAGTVAIN